MQPKTIKSILSKKLEDWFKSIDDEALRALIKRDAIVTGGAIPSLLLGEQPNDFDVYFKTLNTAKAVAEYYVKKFKENPPPKFKTGEKVDIKVVVEEDKVGQADARVQIVIKSQGIAGESGNDSYEYFEQQQSDPSEPEQFVDEIMKDKEAGERDDPAKPKYRPVFMSSNAITLSHKIQIIIRFYGDVQTIHENYDFIHCTCSWEALTGELVLPNEALISLINRRLKYKSSRYPLCSIIRTRKFLKAGWVIDAGQYVKMAYDLHRLDLNNVDVLEDQLTGVDSAYFHEVIGMLREGEKTGKSLDQTYLIEVVDKIFG